MNPFEPPRRQADIEPRRLSPLREPRFLFWNRILAAVCGALLASLAGFALVWTPPEMTKLWILTVAVGLLLTAVALAPIVRRRSRRDRTR